MPTVLRVDGYRLFFYSDERNEPPHVHVVRAGRTAKLWLQPVELARSSGYTMTELTRVWNIVVEHRSLLQEQWDEFHGTGEE
ncbi:MAG: DUF4160 domain-containing protein [Armatimonadetes bacterium]|nr:DUF4160 domain-containing protein [Armatimonadota bacterium]